MRTSRPRSIWSSEIGFAQAYSFKYSARPGTPASSLRSRCRRLVDRRGCRSCRSCSSSRPPRSMPPASARRCQCCWSAHGRHPGQLVGRTPYLQAVHVARPARSRSATSLPVTITECHAHSLAGGRAAGRSANERSYAPEHPRTAPRSSWLEPSDALRRQRRLRDAVRPAPSQPRPDRAEAAGEHRHPRQ